MNTCTAYSDKGEEIGGLIACCLNRNIPFYACRYPSESQVRFGAQYHSAPIRGMVSGFRVVPFVESEDAPAFTIVPDYSAADRAALEALPPLPAAPYGLSGADIDYDTYIGEARRMISCIQAHDASKLVLSRTITLSYDMARMPQLFAALCVAYPSAYVFMVSYPGICNWIGATPELLLRSTNRGYATMALAGTRPEGTPADWPLKEREEQQYVADYIGQVLQGCGLTAVTTHTYTRRAAQVEHLCTDFDISTAHDAAIRDLLLARLHPTPAVAGIPVNDAKKLISAIEGHHRRYYGGYIGDADENGHCRCFVNLRSLEFDARAVRLYVGGGLTARSVPVDEWNETCIKSQTLLSVLNCT